MKKNLHLTAPQALKQYKRYVRKRSRLMGAGSKSGIKMDFLTKRIERLKSFLLDVLKRTKLATAAGALALTLSANSSNAQTFIPMTTNPYGLVSVNGFSAPGFADLDGDGDLDIMTGDNYYGNFTYFQNTGTASAPAFGAPSVNSFGLSASAGYYNTPTFGDLDGDGDFDMMVGSLSDGNIFYFENTGTAAAPTFAAPMTNPFGITIPSYTYYGYYGTYTYSNAEYSDPVLVDIDGDNDLDMFVGNDDDGNLYYYENTGTASAPAFAAPAVAIASWDSAIAPDFGDIDGDGDMDLFTGEGGGEIYFIENTGTAVAPVFSTPIISAFTGLSDVGSLYTNVAVKDLDSDGDLDIMAGASDGSFYYFEQCIAPTAPTNSTPAGDLTICAGETTTLTATGTGTLGWYDAATGGTYLGGGSSFITPALTGAATYFVQDSTCAEGSRTAITVNVNPLPDVTTNLSGATASANLAGATSYQWVTCPAYTNASGTSTNQSYTATSNGDYAVIITNGGCTDTSACVSITSVGINDMANTSVVTVFPNPNDGSFTIQASSQGKFTLTNQVGQLLHTFELTSGNGYTFKMDNLSNGIYFVQETGKGINGRYKIVVTK
ncbi:MAG TPA: FG-GAP-like repeat-containing protein [Flavobacteriales bacterium]|nr:FG-GAP-like repeat-containing protein [Flavobacteriales bacterium]